MSRAERRRGKKPSDHKVTITGGTGGSPERAWVVLGARNTQEAVGAEYDHLSKLYGMEDRMWKRVDARTRAHGDRFCDEIVLESLMPGRARWSVFYDVTEVIRTRVKGLEDIEGDGDLVDVQRFRFTGADGRVVVGALLHGERGHGYSFSTSGPDDQQVLERSSPTLATREEAVAAMILKLNPLVPKPWSHMPWNDSQPTQTPPWKG